VSEPLVLDTLPPSFFDLPHPCGNSGVDLFGVEAGRQGGIRKVDSFRLLADEEDARHEVSPSK
jgi:hypothetical protein